MPADPQTTWNEGGREDVLSKRGLTMTHDELEAQLGTASTALIAAAGFVLVPRQWREDGFAAAARVGRGGKGHAHAK